MNLYSKKQRWKIVLVVLAAVIVGTSLWYTGTVVTKIKNEEKRKVEQWASDVRNSIEQINIADSSFSQQKEAYLLLTEFEKKEAQRWAAAMNELGKDYNDYSFFLKIIQANETIPLILMDYKGEVSEVRNLDVSKQDIRKALAETDSIPEDELNTLVDTIYNDSLQKLAAEWSNENEPILLDYIGTQKFRMYYRHSNRVEDFEKKISALESRSDSLFKAFNARLVTSNKLFPMIYVDAESEELLESNLSPKILNNEKKFREKLEEMKENERIPVKISGETKGYIYYQNSDLVRQLSYYPYVQFGIIGLFLLVSYFLFSTFRKAEQNQVWVGMAKETAHQLGTPISSLMAWTEILKSQGVDDTTITEINKDLKRLGTVTDRFSKIGSGGELSPTKVYPVISSVFDYFEKRVSNKMVLKIEGDTETEAMINTPLFEWVIENLIKNSVDAMEGEGTITCTINRKDNEVHLDITDTGKGVPQGKFKTIFEPGYTSKQRGWGLGLSLVKRIVESYHKGKVFVHKSEPGKGTTFRIVLNKA